MALPNSKHFNIIRAVDDKQCPRVNYSFYPTRFGDVLIASCEHGICALDFADSHEYVMNRLRRRFPKAVRAVGTAVGSNPISLLIPCHRVIRSDGAIGEYHWGRERKAQILQYEKELTSE